LIFSSGSDQKSLDFSIFADSGVLPGVVCLGIYPARISAYFGFSRAGRVFI